MIPSLRLQAQGMSDAQLAGEIEAARGVLRELMADQEAPAFGLPAWENYLAALQDEQARRRKAAPLCPNCPQVADSFTIASLPS